MVPCLENVQATSRFKAGRDKEVEGEREVHHEFELSSDVTVDDGCAAVNLGFSILRRPQLTPPLLLLLPLPPSFLSLSPCLAFSTLFSSSPHTGPI